MGGIGVGLAGPLVPLSGIEVRGTLIAAYLAADHSQPRFGHLQPAALICLISRILGHTTALGCKAAILVVTIHYALDSISSGRANRFKNYSMPVEVKQSVPETLIPSSTKSAVEGLRDASNAH